MEESFKYLEVSYYCNMNNKINTFRKILEIELDNDCSNQSVIGGIDKYIEQNNTDLAFLNIVVNYFSQSIDSRKMICKSLLELIDGNSSKIIVENEVPLSSPQDKLLLYKKLLKDKFQYNDFKIDQRKVIESFIAGKNTLAIMPTGYGKSICFQIPALDVGRTLVISPLIALMSDQVNSLKEKGIGAEYINSTNRKSHNKILHDFKNNKIKILYIAPERFDNELFIKEIKNIDINLFVVDEAHCIVDWGPDFRPNYSSLDNYINELNNPQVMAFTATANPKVSKEIKSKLNFKRNSNTVIANFDRPEIFFRKKYLPFSGNLADEAQREEFVKRRCKYIDSFLTGKRNWKSESGIVYVKTKNETKLFSNYLNSIGYKSAIYHGDLDSKEKERVLNNFMNENIRIIVATKAFGMGINKSNIRYVFIIGIPEDMENFYQQVGRAGRDKNYAECTLISDKNADIDTCKFFINESIPRKEEIEYTWDQLKQNASTGNEKMFEKYVIKDKKKKTYSPLIYYLFNNYIDNQMEFLNLYDIVMNSDTIPDFNYKIIDQRKSELESDLDNMIRFFDSTTCMRVEILKYFNQSYTGVCEKCTTCWQNTKGNDKCKHVYRVKTGARRSSGSKCKKCGKPSEHGNWEDRLFSNNLFDKKTYIPNYTDQDMKEGIEKLNREQKLDDHKTEFDEYTDLDS